MKHTDKTQKKYTHIHRNLLLGGLALTALLNLAAWLAPAVSGKTGWTNWCDWYAEHVNPVLVTVWARAANLAPFSIGEWMLVAAAVLLEAMIVLNILYIFLRRRSGYRRFIRIYDVAIAYIAVVVCLIMTLHCTIYYHCSYLTIEGVNPEKQYTVGELQTLRNEIVERCNDYSTRMERDEDGYILSSGDMQQAAQDALHKLAKDYPRLAGYYPNVKHMMFSDLMSQSYMAGYYFPFSMEANCNGNMYIMNYPATYCHELAHLHGYIYEDEASFLSFLACTGSGDDVMAYAGYLSVLNYVDRAYYEAIGQDEERYLSNVAISDQVRADNQFLLPEAWKKVEENAILDTETVDKASDTFTETSLNLNGVTDGMAAYDRVTELLLQYYDAEGLFQ